MQPGPDAYRTHLPKLILSSKERHHGFDSVLRFFSKIASATLCGILTPGS